MATPSAFLPQRTVSLESKHEEYQPRDMMPHFYVRVVAQEELLCKNVVWLGHEDYRSFFPERGHEVSANHYLEIGDQIYRVALGYLPFGEIAIPVTLDRQVSRFYYMDGKRKRIVATPYYPTSLYTPIASDIKVELIKKERANELAGVHVFRYAEIANKVREVLKREFLTPGRSLNFSFYFGNYTANITAYKIRAGLKPPYKVNILTNIHFVTGPSSGMILSHHAHPANHIERFHFDVKLGKRNINAKREDLPLIYHKHEFIDAVRSVFENQLIAKGGRVTLKHPSGWDVLLTFKDAEFKSAYRNEMVDNNVDYIESFRVTSRSKIQFYFSDNDEVCLREARRTSASFINFEVVSFTPNDEENGPYWISREEFDIAILSAERTYVRREIFGLKLSTGTAQVRIDRILPMKRSRSDALRGAQPQFFISDQTKISLTATDVLNLSLVENDRPRPIQSASFTLLSKHAHLEALNLTLEEMQSVIREQAPKRLLQGGSFEVQTAEGYVLGVKMVAVNFALGNLPAKGLSVLGKITDETEIQVLSSGFTTINLIERIYDEEVKRLKFNLSVEKTKHVIRAARLPIRETFNHLQGLIEAAFRRGEVGERGFLIFGDSVKLPPVNGREITARFLGAEMQREVKDSSDAFVKCKLIKGYAFPPSAPYKFNHKITDLVLVRGEPKEASHLNFRLTKKMEDYLEEDVVEMGSWINLEELRAKIEEMDLTLAIREKVVIELTSGKYLLELRSAKFKEDVEMKDDDVPLQKIKPKHTVFKISRDTKITLNRGVYKAMQVVNDSKVYPLEKVEIEVEPVDEVFDHQMIDHGALKRAILREKPEKLVKSMILTIDTEAGEQFHLEMKELTFNKKDRKIDPTKVFFSIGEETEILFVGKKESKICVQAPPKILSIKNPLKYLHELGLGGIEKQFNQISRVLYSRSDRLKREVERRGGKPIKGVLLYGPPGTGKTTLARHLGGLLGCSGDQIIIKTATEIFNMWFGNSEKSVREMFQPAYDAQDEYGDKSPLYMIVIDEIDAILPKRGSSATKTRDSIVNQFLGCMDGLKELKNIIVVGITNRKEDMDPAALRHGRFGVHIEMGLHDKKAREKIFEIHTRKIKEEGLLAKDVDLSVLADKTKDYSGADIEGIVQEASNFSLERLNKLDGSPEELRDAKEGLIKMADFTKAIENRKKTSGIPEDIMMRMFI